MNSQFEAVDYDPFALNQALEKLVPSTPGQREIWISAKQGDGANCAYNEAARIHVAGEISLAILDHALSHLISHHDSLRASFSADGRSMLIASVLEPDLQVIDQGNAGTGTEESLEAICREEVCTPFDLEQGPLFRVRVVMNGKTDAYILLIAHHLVCDGWSLDTIIEELLRLYAELCHGELTPGPQPAQYSSYAGMLEQAKEEGLTAKHEAYWKKLLENPPPPLQYPFDFEPPVQRSFEAYRYDKMLSGELRSKLRTFGATSKVSLFSTLLSAYASTLYILSQQESLLIGIPVAGQPLSHMNDCVGHLVSFLPILVKLDHTLPFTTLASKIQTMVLDARDHHLCTYGTILENCKVVREPGRPPLVQACFTHTHRMGADRIQVPGLEATYDFLPRAFETFEMYWNLVETDDSLQVLCHYNRNLFKESTIGHMVDIFEHLLSQLCARPDLTLGELDLVPPAQSLLLKEWNGTKQETPTVAGVHELVGQCFARLPDKCAVQSGSVSLTYGQLSAAVDAMIQRLARTGLQARELVGISLERSPDVLVAILALWNLGCAYVPLDPDFPQERLDFMVRDSGMRLILTQKSLSGKFTDPGYAILCTDNPDDCILSGSAKIPPTEKVLAYVMYTSGSTGQPKGVMVLQDALVNFLLSMARQPGMGPSDVLVAVTTISFDISLLELFLPLVTGAQLVIAGRASTLDPDILSDLLRTSNATFMQATPTTWRMLLGAGWSGGNGFKALCGGEALPESLLMQLVPRVGELWNMYGPTETTVWSTCALCLRNEQKASIGKPIDNTTLYILDDLMRPVPIGVQGELYIAGVGLAAGYLNRPELTEQRFLPDLFAAQPDMRMYRTGDICRFKADGRLEYLHRQDNQVKIRGFRIELGEIDAVLCRHPAVAQAASVVLMDRQGEAALASAYVPKAEQLVDVAQLKDFLRSTLPPYMVPSSLIGMSALPLTPNGKVDIKAITAIHETAPKVSASRSPVSTSGLEKTISQVWMSVLDLALIEPTDNFFDAGGNSVSILQIKRALKELHEIEVPVAILFQYPTIRTLAAYLESGGTSSTNERQRQLSQRANLRNQALQRHRDAASGRDSKD